MSEQAMTGESEHVEGGGPTSAEDALRDYFLSAASVAGLRSVHGGLVDSRASGSTGTRARPSPDAAWTDGRARAVRGHARTAHALAALSSAHTTVLHAYYAEPPWPGAAPNTSDRDAGVAEYEKRKQWSRGAAPPEVRNRREMGPALGRVALMTVALADAFAAPSNRAATPQALLVALAQAGGALCAAVEAEAREAHRAALVAFCAASGHRGPAVEGERRRARVRGWTAPLPAPIRVAV